MQSLRLLALAALLTFLGACGQGPEPPAPAAAPATAPPPAATPAAVTPDPAAPAAAQPGTTAPPPATLVEESAGTEPDPAQAGSNIVLPAAAPAPSAPREWKFREGAHYRSLTSAQGTSSSPDKIEVAEVFWYGCPHCYNLEPVIKEWASRLPADVSFVRIPVMWNPTNEIHARVFYTAEALGKLDEISNAMFRAIHLENRMLTEEREIQRLFEQHGVPAATFNQTFRSFGVESQLRRAKDLTTRYRVRGVPLLVINGKYTTDGPEIRNQQEMLALAEELIERERPRG